MSHRGIFSKTHLSLRKYVAVERERERAVYSRVETRHRELVGPVRSRVEGGGLLDGRRRLCKDCGGWETSDPAGIGKKIGAAAGLFTALYHIKRSGRGIS